MPTISAKNFFQSARFLGLIEAAPTLTQARQLLKPAELLVIHAVSILPEQTIVATVENSSDYSSFLGAQIRGHYLACHLYGLHKDLMAPSTAADEQTHLN